MGFLKFPAIVRSSSNDTSIWQYFYTFNEWGYGVRTFC
ncbi:hypothetical protein BMB171_C2946 [Bacillus thuringiensis BMB171]|nr:hypothetical protein BMB171_C2946 [Bacillus thuringiensis BMB171]